MRVEFILNGKQVQVEGSASDRLLDILREHFDLTASKEGCGEGECGTCTILMNGDAVLACLTPLVQLEGSEILTLEGVAANPAAKDFLERFVAKGGTQCGACTPGILVNAWQLHQEDSSQNRDQLRKSLSGNLCRCTGYESILQALEGEE